MSISFPTTAVRRRLALQGAAAGALSLFARPGLGAPDASEGDDKELVTRLLGKTAIESSRVHLVMPPVFGNGYSVPLTLWVDSPMTETDHVRQVHVLAPKNPIIPVATFRFSPRSGRPEISTRIRLAQPQSVLAIAEMSDGTSLMAKTWVNVDNDGCA